MSFKLYNLIGVLVLSLFSGTANAESPALENRPTYRDTQAFMRQLVERYPERARIIELGVSDSGDVIEGLEIGQEGVKNLVVATHHGNEYGSTEVALGLAESLASAPLMGQRLYVIPVLNISGYNARQRRERVGSRSYDPNRDYPGPCGTEGPFHLKSTAALARFIDREGIVTTATLHTYTPAVVYPWGLTTRDTSTLYDDIFRMLAQAATVESGYKTGNSTEVIYPADGTYEDYAFWKHGIWAMLFELGFSHFPGADAIREMIRVNVPGLRRMMEQAPRQRAENHEFTGNCGSRKMLALDRHDE